MKWKFMMLFAALWMLGVGLVFGDTVLQIQRIDSRINSGFRERIYIDGKSKLTLANGASGTITVPDGTHTIYADLYTMRTEELSFSCVGGTVQISITANSLNDFFITMGGAAVSAPVASSPAAKPAAGGTSAPQPAAGQLGILKPGIEGAVARACVVFIGELTAKSTIAVLSISSKDADLANFAIDELEYQLVTAKQFTMVDRKTLDSLRTEQKFQLSGEVSDSSAVAIGNLLGANIVITGSVSGLGNTQRLTLKALDVKTAQIITMAREQF